MTVENEPWHANSCRLVLDLVESGRLTVLPEHELMLEFLKAKAAPEPAPVELAEVAAVLAAFMMMIKVVEYVAVVRRQAGAGNDGGPEGG